jgi:hypothetical protein
MKTTPESCSQEPFAPTSCAGRPILAKEPCEQLSSKGGNQATATKTNTPTSPSPHNENPPGPGFVRETTSQDRLFQADIFGVAHQAVGFFVGIKAQRDEASAKAADEHVYSAVTARHVRKDILAIYPADAGVSVVIRKEAVHDLVLLLSKGGFVFGQEYGNPAHLYKKHCANGEPQIGDGQKQLTSPPD